MKRISSALAVVMLLALVCTSEADGQNSRKKLKKENLELKAQLDSIRRAFEDLKTDYQVKDSIANELMEIYREHDSRSAAGLNPEDYNPDVTDSLLNIWYLHHQIKASDEGEGYDMDSVTFSSNVPDSVFKERLVKMNSFITLPYNETVRNYIILYSEKMPTKMSNILGLCRYYMPIFEETFNKYDLPDELKYVAIIESALNPVAVSRAGAKGLWQFMMKTAKSYGLEINSYVDERFDPFKSADAAARYLSDMYKLFGDWNLAISSYNCGPGNVNKAIRRSGSREFWDVYRYLPRETRGYVPALVGAMYAMKYSKENGLTPNAAPLPAQVDTFEIRRDLHFQQISDVAGIPMDDLKNLNPQYIKDIIPGSGKPYILRLPFNHTSSFISNEDSIYRYKVEELFNPQLVLHDSKSSKSSATSSARTTYTVRKGDYLGKIASRYRVSVGQLKEWNDLKSNNIRVGQKLYIYGRSTSSSGGSTSGSKASTSGNYVTYTVKKGDTISGIAKMYSGVTASMIMSYNGIGSTIHPGMKIKIPQ